MVILLSISLRLSTIGNDSIIMIILFLVQPNILWKKKNPFVFPFYFAWGV